MVNIDIENKKINDNKRNTIPIFLMTVAILLSLLPLVDLAFLRNNSLYGRSFFWWYSGGNYINQVFPNVSFYYIGICILFSLGFAQLLIIKSKHLTSAIILIKGIEMGLTVLFVIITFILPPILSFYFSFSNTLSFFFGNFSIIFVCLLELNAILYYFYLKEMLKAKIIILLVGIIVIAISILLTYLFGLSLYYANLL